MTSADPEPGGPPPGTRAAAPPGLRADDEPTSASADDSPAQRERRARLRRDRLLIRRLQQRDPRAFRELVEAHQHRVFGLVYRMLGDRQEAEDVAQEVFLSVHRAIDGYRGEAQLATWLYRIATNACRNRIKYLQIRADRRSAEYDPGRAVDGHASAGAAPLHSHLPDPEQATHGHHIEQIVQRELAALDPEHRIVLVLRDIEGLSYGEIVDVTGLAEGTVKSRLHRARVALKARLEPYLR